MATTAHKSAAALLGKRGAQKRWKSYSASDRTQLQKLIQQGKAKRQNENFAIANALFRLANKLANQKRGR
jgi:hypothetical protein